MGSATGGSSASAAGKEDVSQALGHAINAPPGRSERREGPAGTVAHHSQEGWNQRIQVDSVALGVAEGKVGVFGEGQVTDCVGVRASYNVSASVVALWTVTALVLEAIRTGSETVVDLHVNWQHHLAGAATSTRVHPLVGVDGGS